MVREAFFHKLEVLALQKNRCEIIFLDNAGKLTIRDHIEGLYGSGDAMVLALGSGREIPLLKLISVDGMAAEMYC